MKHRELDDRIDRVAALGDPARRALYDHVAHQADPVTRDEAASAVGVAHHIAKFHLDRLVTEGLLEADYRRPPGRGGPGAGRPAKVYRAVGEVEVSLPERRYDLAGQLLVRAVSTATKIDAPVADVLDSVARAAGREAATPRRKLTDVLESYGFEPDKQRGDIVLRNCPFHRLAEEDRELVCTMNLAFVRGVLEGVGESRAEATLDPLPGGCCVRIAG